MRPVIFHNLIPQLRQDMMEYPGAVDNVEILIQSKVPQIRAEEINIRLMDIRQPSGFFNSGFRHIKGRDLITISGEKNGILSFSAAHLQKPERPCGIVPSKHFHAHFIRHGSPVIFLRIIAILIGCYHFLFGDISHQCIDIRFQYSCQRRKQGDIGKGLGIFPFGYRLGRNIQLLSQFFLGIAL